MRKLLSTFAACATVAALSVTGATAATIVGDPSQTNSQQHAGSQTGVQAGSSGLVVGPSGQTAANTNTLAGSSTQLVGSPTTAFIVPSSTIVGTPRQTNGQSGTTTQATVQSTGGSGTQVGASTQTAGNSDVNGFAAAQLVTPGGFCIIFCTAPGGTLVGSPVQASSQLVGATQGIAQTSATGTRVGAATQGGANVESTALTDAQRVRAGGFCLIICIAVPGTIVGSPSQIAGQSTSVGQSIGQSAGAAIVVGASTQGAANTNTSTETNVQRVRAPSVCIIICAAGGGTIVGSPSQAVSQIGVQGQLIGQSVTGGTIVGGIGQAQTDTSSATKTSSALIL